MFQINPIYWVFVQDIEIQGWHLAGLSLPHRDKGGLLSLRWPPLMMVLQ